MFQAEIAAIEALIAKIEAGRFTHEDWIETLTLAVGAKVIADDGGAK